MRIRIKPLAAILATAQASSLRRSLGVFQLTMLGIGATIGTGIFVRPGAGRRARLIAAPDVAAVIHAALSRSR